MKLTAVDFIIDSETRKRAEGISFHEANIERLPFPDKSFDTVICTHVLEHILDFRGALAELRRVAAKRLIIVVPQEREYRFTFNPHLHFFPYPHSYLRYATRSEEHTSELQSLMRLSYAVFCLTTKNKQKIDSQPPLTHDNIL